MQSVVMIFPHPDDDAFGMGGTAMLMKDRFKLHTLCLTKGERGLSADPIATTAAMREQEAVKWTMWLLANKLAERFFQKVKEVRRIATRYERLAVTYGAMVSLAATTIWLS